MATIHAASTPGGDHSWRNSSNSHLPTPKSAGDSETNVQNSLGLQRTFWEAKAICCTKTQKTNVSFCPKTFTMAEDPKANTVWEKCEKRVEGNGDKCKEVMGEPCAEPFRKLTQPSWNPGGTSAKPGWNLPRNLLAAQDGSAPENHTESKSNSAPRPLLWLKTPKLLLLGKNYQLSFIRDRWSQGAVPTLRETIPFEVPDSQYRDLDLVLHSDGPVDNRRSPGSVNKNHQTCRGWQAGDLQSRWIYCIWPNGS